MLRSFFLYLSSATWMRRLITALPFATRLSRRFVAGETLDDAMGLEERRFSALDHGTVHAPRPDARGTHFALE